MNVLKNVLLIMNINMILKIYVIKNVQKKQYLLLIIINIHVKLYVMIHILF